LFHLVVDKTAAFDKIRDNVKFTKFETQLEFQEESITQNVACMDASHRSIELKIFQYKRHNVGWTL